MGLLDIFNTMEGQQGLGLLAAAGPRSDGAGFGQRLQEGLGMADQWKRKKAQDEFQQMQIEAYKAKVLQEKQAMEAAMAKRAALPTLFTPSSAGAPALSVDSLLPPELRAGTMPQAAVAPRRGGIDVQKALASNYTPDEIFKLDSLRNVGMDEVARVEKVMQNGREVAQQLDKYGRPVSQGMEVYKAPIMMDRGGQTDVVSPYIQPGQSFAKTMTFADKNAAGNLSLSREKFNFDKNGGGDGYSTKPLPASALKMQNDAIDVIGAAGGINQMLTKVETQIADKKVKFGPISNLVSQGLNSAGMSTEESRNFSSFKSDLEKIRNESLRLNSGVQTDGDAQRAWNELFQNINDTELVKQRLGEIKTLNNRAVELQKLKVDGIRGNYKASPYDYGKMPDASPASKPMEALPTANSSNKGRAIRDTTTGKVLRSNGISWVEEK